MGAPVGDAVRTAALEAEGWQVLRFWNGDVWANVEGTMTLIAEGVEQHGGVVEFVSPRRRGD